MTAKDAKPAALVKKRRRKRGKEDIGVSPALGRDGAHVDFEDATFAARED